MRDAAWQHIQASLEALHHCHLYMIEGVTSLLYPLETVCTD